MTAPASAPAPGPGPAPAGRRAQKARRVAAGAQLAAGLASIAALVAACGSAGSSAGSSASSSPGSSAGSSSGPQPTLTVTATPTAGGSTIPAAGASTIPAAASSGATAAASATACPTRSLQVKVGVAQGTAGSVYTALDFVNISNVSCSLYGYPGVSLAGGNPVTQIGPAAVEDHTSARELVALAPHAVANALLKITDAGNYPASRCGPVTAHYLQIFPPNQTTPIYVGYTSKACSKSVAILAIGPVRPGSGSSS